MATYLYGFLLSRNAHLVPPHIAGIDGALVRVIECGELGALVSSVEQPRSTGRPSLDAVRAHDHALQAAVHHGATVAAGRFGQRFASDDECRLRILDEMSSMRGVLADRDGCVEMRLLMAAPTDTSATQVHDAPSVGAGRAYLEQLRRRRERTGHLGVRAALGPVVLRERVEEIADGRGIAFSHLIERTREDEYRAAVAALPALAAATLVGPLALYAFADATEP